MTATAAIQAAERMTRIRRLGRQFMVLSTRDGWDYWTESRTMSYSQAVSALQMARDEIIREIVPGMVAIDTTWYTGCDWRRRVHLEFARLQPESQR